MRRLTAVLAAVCSIALLTAAPAPAADRPVVRVAGGDRFSTAVELSKAFYPGGADFVYLANGRSFADALTTSAAIAGQGPLLLTERDTLPAATKAEIMRLQPDGVLLVGGTSAISTAVENEVAAIEPIGRIQGPNRYATAVEVSKTLFSSSTHALIATGEQFPDALSAAAVGNFYTAPVLLTLPNSLPSVTAAELDRLGVTDIVIVGGESAVSPAVAAALAAARPGANIGRVAGADRYATAAEMVRLFFPASNGLNVFVATGRDFPDALAAASHAHAWGALLLTPPDNLHGAAATQIARLNSAGALIVGGTNVVSTNVENQVRALLASL